MRFSEVIGQGDMIMRLRNLADNNRLPHAIMLCGPEGAGKMALAISFASYLLCTGRNGDGGMFGDGSTADDSCGNCPSCTMLKSLQHPDMHFSFPTIRPKGTPSDKKIDSDEFITEWREMINRGGGYFSLQEWLDEMKVENQQSVISVAESDRLNRVLSMKSNQGGKKVAIIWLPEKMNIECANKLLKLIEEPPSETHFILVSVHPEQLLDTIQSRVQRFDVRPIALSDMVEALQKQRGLSEEDATRTARLAAGNWTTAISLLEPGNEEAWFFDMYMMLMRMAYARKVNELKKWSEQIAGLGREKQIRMLNSFQRMTREFFMYNFHKPELIYMTLEQENFAKKFSPFINERNIIGIYELFQRTIRDIGQNANPKIQFFDLTMKMAVLIHSSK